MEDARNCELNAVRSEPVEEDRNWAVKAVRRAPVLDWMNCDPNAERRAPVDDCRNCSPKFVFSDPVDDRSAVPLTIVMTFPVPKFPDPPPPPSLPQTRFPLPSVSIVSQFLSEETVSAEPEMVPTTVRSEVILSPVIFT